MKEKIQKIFPILTIILIPVYFYLGIALLFMELMNDYSGIAGIIFGTATRIGALTAPVGILGVILGFILRKKGKKKAGVIVPLLGLMIGVPLLLGFIILDCVETVHRKASDVQWYIDTYGEDWDAPSKIEGIPKQYEWILNQVYASLRDEWEEDRLFDSLVFTPYQTMYYEGNALENLGFTVTDLNGDGDTELVIAPINDVAGYENLLLKVYVEKENPFALYHADESHLYYLHSAGDGTYYVECERTWDDGTSDTFVYKITEGLSGYDDYYDIEVDIEVEAEDRMKLELIPFSEYK